MFKILTGAMLTGDARFCKGVGKIVRNATGDLSGVAAGKR